MKNKKTLGTGRFLHLVEVDRWEYVDRVIASGVVAVAAVTDDARLILVEQFRPPVGRRLIFKSSLVEEGRTVLMWSGGREHLLPDAVIPFTGLCR